MGKDRERRSVRDNVRNRADKKSGDGWVSTSLVLPEGTHFFSVKKAGVRRIDILPYEVKQDGNPFAAKGSLHYERTYWAHRGIGPNNDSYICSAKTFNKKCPICEYRAKLQKDPDAEEQMVKDLAPKERQLFNVIDTAERDKGIQLWM